MQPQKWWNAAISKKKISLLLLLSLLKRTAGNGIDASVYMGTECKASVQLILSQLK
jgi:hypothetical protein